jgi:hypothetical protein
VEGKEEDPENYVVLRYEINSHELSPFFGINYSRGTFNGAPTQKGFDLEAVYLQYV